MIRLTRECSALGDLQCVRVRTALTDEERHKPSTLNTRDRVALWNAQMDVTCGRLGLVIGGCAAMSTVMVAMPADQFYVVVYHDVHLERVDLPCTDAQRIKMKAAAFRVIAMHENGLDPRTAFMGAIGCLAPPLASAKPMQKKRARK